MAIGKTIVLTLQTFFGKVMSLLFSMLLRLVIVFLLRGQRLLISWLQSFSICSDFLAQICHCFYCFPIYLLWSDGTRCHELHFLNMNFKPAFSLSSFTLIQRLFSSTFWQRSGVTCVYEVVDISPCNLDSSLSFTQPSILHDVLCI